MAALISGESVVASRVVPAPTPVLATRAMSAVSEFTRPLFHGAAHLEGQRQRVVLQLHLSRQAIGEQGPPSPLHLPELPNEPHEGRDGLGLEHSLAESGNDHGALTHTFAKGWPFTSKSYAMPSMARSTEFGF
jgi:hypothetical protein